MNLTDIQYQFMAEYDADLDVMRISISREPAYSTIIFDVFEEPWINWRLNKQQLVVGADVASFSELWPNQDNILQDLWYILRIDDNLMKNEMAMAFERGRLTK